ncbi:MAG TPA: hypothetical protein VG738_16910 [Chitinophagaceae bacterium]|nr:hypothetical protein [Chitinophagaceae bacterium]
MLLDINDEKTIGDLQDRFSECFPNLKIEFYKNAHSWHGRSLPKQEIAPGKKLKDIRRKHENSLFQIKSTSKTGDIEAELKKRFGLFAQVYYNTNNTWTETTGTDDLTLKQLMLMAKGVTTR